MVKNEGAWIDTRTGQVVTVEPEEGIQLAAPGTEISDEVAALVEAAKPSKGKRGKETATAPAASEARD